MIPSGQKARQCICGRPAVKVSWLDMIVGKDERWLCTTCAEKEIQLMVDMGKKIMERQRDTAELAG